MKYNFLIKFRSLKVKHCIDLLLQFCVALAAAAQTTGSVVWFLVLAACP